MVLEIPFSFSFKTRFTSHFTIINSIGNQIFAIALVFKTMELAYSKISVLIAKNV